MKYINAGSSSLLASYIRLKIVQENRRPKVIKLCERLQTLEGKQDTVAQSILAVSYFEMGDEEKALHHGTQVLNVDPYNVFMLKLLVPIYFRRGEHPIVYGYVQRALSRLPDEQAEKIMAQGAKWIGKVLQMFRMVPKLRDLSRKVGQSRKEYLDGESEWLKWAHEYKKWYEERLVFGENPMPPWQDWKSR